MIITKKVAAPQQITSWSFSRLNKYEECPARAKFNFIDRLPEPGSPAMDRGAAIHKEGEDYLKGVLTEIPESYKLLGVELEEVKQLGAKSELEITFNKDWEPTGWFDADAWCRIKVDIMLVDDKTIRIIDIKTGKNRGGYEDQLELYALAALLTLPDHDHVVAELWFVDSGEIIATSHGSYSQKDVPELKEKWNQRVKPMLVDTMFAPRPGAYCRYCPFAKVKGGKCEY